MAINNDRTIMYKDSHQELEFEVIDVEFLFGTVIEWEMGKSRTSTPVIEKTDMQIGRVDNKFTVSILPTDNIDLEPGVYYHEARITDSEGNTRPVATGLIEVVDTLTESGD